MPQETFKVLVIGNRGFLGEDVFNFLSKKIDVDVIGLDYPEIDVSNISSFDLVANEIFDVVVCAFGKNHHISNKETSNLGIDDLEIISDYLKVNLYGLKNVFDFFLTRNAKTKFIHFNSMYSREIPNPIYYENEVKSLGYVVSKTSAGALLKYYAVHHKDATFIDFIIGAVENNQPFHFKSNFKKDLIRKELLEKRTVSEFTYTYIKLGYVTGCLVDITGGKL